MLHPLKMKIEIKLDLKTEQSFYPGISLFKYISPVNAQTHATSLQGYNKFS